MKFWVLLDCRVRSVIMYVELDAEFCRWCRLLLCSIYAHVLGDASIVCTWCRWVGGVSRVSAMFVHDLGAVENMSIMYTSMLLDWVDLLYHVSVYCILYVYVEGGWYLHEAIGWANNKWKIYDAYIHTLYCSGVDLPRDDLCKCCSRTFCGRLSIICIVCGSCGGLYWRGAMRLLLYLLVLAKLGRIYELLLVSRQINREFAYLRYVLRIAAFLLTAMTLLDRIFEKWVRCHKVHKFWNIQ